VLRHAVYALYLVTLPFSCFGLLGACNSANPMLHLFLVDFEVENRSGEEITVTPLGVAGPAGSRFPLPIYTQARLAFPAVRTGGFRLAPGEVLRVRFDWDDINLSELVVSARDGTTRVLIADPAPESNQYHPPLRDRFVVPPLSTLRAPSPELLRVAAAARYDFTTPLMPVMVASPVVVMLLHRRLSAGRGAVAGEGRLS
jgi:hypothetical protein